MSIKNFLSNIKLLITNNRIFLIKITVLIIVAFIYLDRAGYHFEKEPFVEGDGLEYVLMTESIFNHLSVDVQKQDVVSFKNAISKNYDWNSFAKKEYFEAMLIGLESPKHSFKENTYGYFYSKQNKFYSYHFYTYSIFCLPAKIIGNWCGSPILHTFYKTNALLVIITCIFLLFYFIKNHLISIISTLCFAFGSCYWYIGWEHTEIFTTCLVTIGLILFLKEKKLIGIFIIAIATSQNQPLLFLLAFLCIWAWYINKFNLKYLLKLILVSFISIFPQLFYFYHFETTNLIKDLGFLDTKYIGLNRLFSFFFDLNQGMILAMPIILLTYCCLIIRKLFKGFKNYSFDLLMPLVIIVMVLIVSSMGAWNPGQAIVHRYTTWIGAIVFVHCFYLLNQLSASIRLSLLNQFITSQIFICFYFVQFIKFDFDCAHHNKIAKWVLENNPDLYSPDPVIFCVRTSQKIDLNEDGSPIIYFNEKHQVCKIMFHKNKVNDLTQLGFTKEQIAKFKKITDIYGWCYIKNEDLNNIRYNLDIYKKMREEKVKMFRNKILNTPKFMEGVNARVKETNLPIEHFLDIDAEYLMTEDEKQNAE